MAQTDEKMACIHNSRRSYAAPWSIRFYRRCHKGTPARRKTVSWRFCETQMTSPFDKEKRRSWTPQQRARFFAAHDGVCNNCKRRIRPGEVWHIDHITSLECQGTNDDDNLQLLCFICHGAKTPQDRKQAATTKRKYTKNIVPKKHQKKSGFRGWRRFNGDPVWSQSR